MTLLQRFWRWLLALLGDDRQPPPAGKRPAAFRRETDGLPVDGPQQPAGNQRPPPLPAAGGPAPAAGSQPPAVAPTPPAGAGGDITPPMFDLPIRDDAHFSVWASLLTQREQITYRTLLRACAGRYQVMAKVRLWDFLHLDSEPAQGREYRTRLACRHVDFLLCDPYTLRPRLAIELDDHSHLSPKGQADDRFKNDLFAAAGLPLLRLDSPHHSARQLRERVTALLGESEEGGAAQNP